MPSRRTRYYAFSGTSPGKSGPILRASATESTMKSWLEIAWRGELLFEESSAIWGSARHGGPFEGSISGSSGRKLRLRGSYCLECLLSPRSQSRRLSSWVASALWLGRPSGQHPSETHGGSVQPAAVRLREEASPPRGALRARGTQT